VRFISFSGKSVWGRAGSAHLQASCAGKLLHAEGKTQTVQVRSSHPPIAAHLIFPTERITLPGWKALQLLPIIACYTNLFHLYERTLPLFYLPTYCPTCNVLPHTLNILSPNTKSSIGVAVRFSKWTVFGDCQNTVTSPPNGTPIILVFLHDMLFKHSEIWQGYRMEFISNIHVVFIAEYCTSNNWMQFLSFGISLALYT